MSDIIESKSNHFIPEMNYDMIKNLIYNHTSTANYNVFSNSKETECSTGPDIIFTSNEDIWENIIYKNLCRTDINIILKDFFLFEWFPRSPGLFYTNKGILARSEASKDIESIDTTTVIYNPNGKLSMLDGGVGNIRLKPIQIGIDYYYLMSASSNSVCHEGFPVALPINLYNKYIDEIKERGAIGITLIGNLKFVPEKLGELYRNYTDVPQLCLYVKDIRLPNYHKNQLMEKLQVSVAISFLSSFEGNNKVYASFVNFDPSNDYSFHQSLIWMKEKYVSGRYKGKIITDFDEQERHFENTYFSLNKVMALDLRMEQLMLFANEMGLNPGDIFTNQTKLILLKSEVNYTMNNFGDTYNNVGKVEHNAPEIRANTIGNIDLSKTKFEQVNKDDIIKHIQDLKNNLNELELNSDDTEEAKNYLNIIESNIKKDNKEKTADNLNNLLTLTTTSGNILAEVPKIATCLTPVATWLGELTAKYPIFSYFHF